MLINKMGSNDVIGRGRSAPDHRRMHQYHCYHFAVTSFLFPFFLLIDVKHSLCSGVGEKNFIFLSFLFLNRYGNIETFVHIQYMPPVHDNNLKS